MASNEVLSVLVNNDVSIAIQITTYNGQLGAIVTTGNPPTVQNPGTPYNITGVTGMTFYLKASSTALDSTATTYTVGSGITVVSNPLGKITLAIPHSANTTVGQMWYRLDTTVGGVITTVLYGPYFVLAV